MKRNNNKNNENNKVDSWVAMVLRMDYSDVVEDELNLMTDYHATQEEAENEAIEYMNEVVTAGMYDIDEDQYRVVTFKVMEEDTISRDLTFSYDN